MKKVLLFFLILIMATMYSFPVSAIEYIDVKSSIFLSSYEAKLLQGKSSCEIDIQYNAQSSRKADLIGVSSIQIYKSNGEYVTTITGTTKNGLISVDSNFCDGTYTKALTSGVSYYAKVTVFAEIGSSRDSRTITTNTVKAP